MPVLGLGLATQFVSAQTAMLGFVAAASPPSGATPGDRQPGIAADPTTLYIMKLTVQFDRGRNLPRSFLLQRAQPAMVGLIDGWLSTLAPIFAVAFARATPGQGRPAPPASLICWP